MKLLCLLSCLIAVFGNRAEENTRFDAERDPFESMTLADADGPSSALFDSCLSASRTVEARIFSIEVTTEGLEPTTTEYFRYVPDSYQTLGDPAWDPVTGRDPPVSSIADCAEAAYSRAYPMFKYSGGSDCLVSNRSYDMTYEPACEDEEQDAVFISVDIRAWGCTLPAFALLQLADGTMACITVNPGPMTVDQAETFCSSVNGEIFRGPSDLIQPSNIQNILNELPASNGEPYKFVVNSILGSYWEWLDAASSLVDTTMMVGAPSTSEYDVMYFSGADDFKFDFAPLSDFMGGVVCLQVGAYTA